MNYEFQKMYDDERWKKRSLAVRDHSEFENYKFFADFEFWCCSRCGKDFYKKKHLLHAHHTYYWAGEPPWSDKYEVGDIIPLCYECHKKVHDTQKIEVKILPGSNYNYTYINYWEDFERKRREEEKEWMSVYQFHYNNDLVDEDGYSTTNVYYRINQVSNWKNKSKGDKIKYGQYASKMCNFLGIDPEIVAVKEVWKTEKSYPQFILEFIGKKIKEGVL